MQQPSAPPIFQPNTCYMGTGTSYGATAPSAPPNPEYEGYTPGWSYTDYTDSQRFSIVPVELVAGPEKPESQNKPLDRQCRVLHHFSWFLQLSAVTTLILAVIIDDWFIAIATGCCMTLYLIENTCSTTMSYLKHFMWENEARNFIQTLRETAPIIQFEIRCYHYETRYRTVTDSDGNTRTESYTVRVDTHAASKDYDYDIYKDYTQFPPFSYSVMKMALKEVHLFEDTYTESHFNNSKHEFILRNDRDAHYDFWVSRVIPGMKKRVLVEVQPGARNKYWTPGCFCCSIFTCWAPCFRMWFLKTTGKEYVRITKSVQKLPLSWYQLYVPVPVAAVPVVTTQNIGTMPDPGLSGTA